MEILIFLFSPQVKDSVLHSDYPPGAIQDEQLISEELSREDDLIEEELIIYVECGEDESPEWSRLFSILLIIL